MRKRLIDSVQEAAARGDNWLPPDAVAEIEVSSEQVEHPIESVFGSNSRLGWRAAGPGEQTIRLVFAGPLRLRHIRLVFHEQEAVRTHEFVVRWSSDGGQSYGDVVRQQFNFSPPGTTDEIEDYHVNLEGVTTLELRIVPDISGQEAYATLQQLRVG
jgi:hypothetical protein